MAASSSSRHAEQRSGQPRYTTMRDATGVVSTPSGGRTHHASRTSLRLRPGDDKGDPQRGPQSCIPFTRCLRDAVRPTPPRAVRPHRRGATETEGFAERRRRANRTPDDVRSSVHGTAEAKPLGTEMGNVTTDSHSRIHDHRPWCGVECRRWLRATPERRGPEPVLGILSPANPRDRVIRNPAACPRAEHRESRDPQQRPGRLSRHGHNQMQS
jgi:hypothetical protein